MEVWRTVEDWKLKCMKSYLGGMKVLLIYTRLILTPVTTSPGLPGSTLR